MIPPKKILITSDDSEIEYVSTVKGASKNEVVYTYRFIKAKEKMGMEFTMDEKNLERNLKNFFKIIK